MKVLKPVKLWYFFEFESNFFQNIFGLLFVCTNVIQVQLWDKNNLIKLQPQLICLQLHTHFSVVPLLILTDLGLIMSRKLTVYRQFLQCLKFSKTISVFNQQKGSCYDYLNIKFLTIFLIYLMQLEFRLIGHNEWLC